MKLSLNWLQQYVNLDGIDRDRLEEALTLIGFEVEGVEELGVPPLQNVQVGEVLTSEQHPNADRLSVCTVKVDEGEPRQIVCGAKNFKVGDRVPVALPGARLPGDFKIKKSKLRGVPSEGMMCAASELGLSQDSDGLLILEERPEIGTPINEVFTDTDLIFDIEVTPNRPDCLSHIGMARELAATFHRELQCPETSLAKPSGTENLLSEVRLTSETCPLYHAYSMRGVKVGPSPDWLCKRLEAVGLRPINNVVDITNFVLLETGQPLHAFDAAKIRGGYLEVRQAAEGEKITTLDEKERTLTDRMAVIADAERALVVAGVMGSIDAEVDETTTDVVLEAAWFNPSHIRMASRRLTLSSDSSYRFERGVDPHGTQAAAERAAALMLELAGGELTAAPLIVGELPEPPAAIALDADFVRERCGFGPEDDEAIAESLRRLACGVEGENGRWQVSPPTFRRDLERPIDLVEEFLRLYGTDRIPESELSAGLPLREDSPLSRFQSQACDLLRGRGYSECVHYSFRDAGELEQLFSPDQVKGLALANPLASDQGCLRPSLLPGLLDALAHNAHHGNAVDGLFEAGRVFRHLPGEEGGLYELEAVAALSPAGSQDRQWLAREKNDFYHLKGLAEALLQVAGIRIEHPIFETLAGEPLWQEGHSAIFGTLEQEGFEVRAGLLDLRTTRDRDIAEPCWAVELLIKPELFFAEHKRVAFKPFSAFPASHRDLALLVDRWIPSGSVRDELEGVSRLNLPKGLHVEQVELFDLYEGEGLAENKKSLAFQIRFRSNERTLKDDEVNEVFQRIQEAITKSGEYQLRS